MCCRPQDIPRTRSWPTTGGAALLPMRYGPGVSPHEAQSHQLTAAHICRSTLLDDQEFRHRREPLSVVYLLFQILLACVRISMRAQIAL